MNHHRCYISIPMDVSAILNVTTMQRRRCYINVPMNVSAILNVITTQSRRRYINIRIDVSPIMNVITTQQCGCYANIQMNVFAIAYVATTQRCKRCTSDSPGLTSESEVYPGSFAVSGNNAVGVVPFIPQCFIVAFHAENVQHLRRCSPHYMHNPG